MSSSRSRKRWDPDRNDVQAVVEILAEIPALDRGVEIAVRGGEDAHVDVNRMTAAHPLDLALLQHAQQRDLGIRRKLAHLVQEDGAAVGRSNRPSRRCTAPVKAPFSCPKSSEVMSEGGIAAQLTPDERSAPSGRPPVDGASDQLLSGSRLAQ